MCYISSILELFINPVFRYLLYLLSGAIFFSLCWRVYRRVLSSSKTAVGAAGLPLLECFLLCVIVAEFKPLREYSVRARLAVRFREKNKEFPSNKRYNKKHSVLLLLLLFLYS